MCIFLAELNGMEAYATNIGNTYLKAGPEFGPLEGHLLIIYKFLYGLRSSGLWFHELLGYCLKELGFKPFLCEPEIFKRQNQEGLWEYVATFVDDLCIVMRNPNEFLEIFKSNPYNFKLKGAGPLSFHLGCGFEQDADGILCMDPKKYISKMEDLFKQLFSCMPNKKYRLPLEDGNHPELDTSKFLAEDDIQKYQSLVGDMQWAVSIG